MKFSTTQTQQLMLIELRFQQKRSSVAEYLLLHQNRDLDEESVASSAEGREIQIKESNEFLAWNNLGILLNNFKLNCPEEQRD